MNKIIISLITIILFVSSAFASCKITGGACSIQDLKTQKEYIKSPNTKPKTEKSKLKIKKNNKEQKIRR